MRPNANAAYEWLRTGEEAFAAKLRAIEGAGKSVRLEYYIFKEGPVGHQMRSALVSACQRGVRVRVLIDAFGSMELSESYWAPLLEAGGEFRWFNPLSFRRLGFRDHRKLLVCDKSVAIVGGFNIGPEYAGDGVTSGWCDHGMEIRGGLVPELAAAFDHMFARADFQHLLFTRLRKSTSRHQVPHADSKLLLCGPGRGRNHFKTTLHQDLKQAADVKIVSAYFLPGWRLRRDLRRVIKQGGRVQVLLGAKSDVPIAQVAAQSLYQSLLRAGVEIYEYQPQVLHAKLVIVDDAVYAGSANLDTRSLHINYELMVRVTNRETVAQASEIFAADLAHAVPVDKTAWPKTRGFWAKLKERWAYFILARVDPYIAHRQLRYMST